MVSDRDRLFFLATPTGLFCSMKSPPIAIQVHARRWDQPNKRSIAGAQTGVFIVFLLFIQLTIWNAITVANKFFFFHQNKEY